MHIFSEPSITTHEKLEQSLAKYLKTHESTFFDIKLMLKEYKQYFGHLSGLEINQEVHSKVENFMSTKLKVE